MPGQWFEGFIRSFGLEAEDVPKVAGAFLVCKYATWGTGIALGVRYKPLRRVFLARSAISKAQPWAQRHRQQLLELWERARAKQTPPVRPAMLQAAAAATGADCAVLRHSARKIVLRRRWGMRASDARRRISFRWREAVHSAICAGWHSRAGHKLLQCKQLAQRQRRLGHTKLVQIRATYSAFSARWRKRAVRKLLRFQSLLHKQRQLRQKQLAQLRASPAPRWYEWVSAKYWKYADKLEVLARKSRAGRFCSANLGVKPQGLALGFAEGTILFKFTSPLVLPLQLWLLVNFFKRQRSLSAPATCDEPCSHMDSTTEKRLAPV